MRALAVAALVLALPAFANAAPSPAPTATAAGPKASVGSRWYSLESPIAHWNPGSGAFTAGRSRTGS